MDDVPEIVNSPTQLAHSLPAIPESRILCNLGCQIDCPHIAWTLRKDGWVVFKDDKLIWVPPDLQKVLLSPQNNTLMSMNGFLQLDLDRNKLGERWREYFQPERLSN
ncbi:hypothetical protein FRC12_008995 [Ceratobasidium sp. 428]|nr:hypothetical protein FRC12_008995 [Ceratobasidium sp. 428]